MLFLLRVLPTNAVEVAAAPTGASGATPAGAAARFARSTAYNSMRFQL